MYCWGNNSSGQLGLGHTNNIKNPQPFTFFEKNQVKLYAGSNFTMAHTSI